MTELYHNLTRPALIVPVMDELTMQGAFACHEDVDDSSTSTYLGNAGAVANVIIDPSVFVSRMRWPDCRDDALPPLRRQASASTSCLSWTWRLLARAARTCRARSDVCKLRFHAHPFSWSPQIWDYTVQLFICCYADEFGNPG